MSIYVTALSRLNTIFVIQRRNINFLYLLFNCPSLKELRAARKVKNLVSLFASRDQVYYHGSLKDGCLVSFARVCNETGNLISSGHLFTIRHVVKSDFFPENVLLHTSATFDAKPYQIGNPCVLCISTKDTTVYLISTFFSMYIIRCSQIFCRDRTICLGYIAQKTEINRGTKLT